ncbi:putative ABC transport system permease protein [Kineothrix alysoides]|uniref:Putative ABC transport system permease protein n=1 Tax=Kineothrix alysoides TaxID=1469948 RepID=A0A4R1QL32_9FIRM|nr:ABC transporter permease [Kineothrix alysoides]TCL53887.1 putative ABC transport system permease protein [Kineothrix alysoides]
MMKVKNKKTIYSLSLKTLRGNAARNLIAVAAIALTTILFTSLFTISMSINRSFQQENFRQAGGYAHGSFKYLTETQAQELSGDKLIKAYGFRRFVGMPSGDPFRKAHVEVSWCDENEAKWMFLKPKEGRLPMEGTNEAATDTRVLSLLGISPKLGEDFTMTFDVDGQETTQTFTLCGWWEYDEAIVASHVLLPQSRAEQIFSQMNTQGNDGMTSMWNMDVMFKNSMHIAEDVNEVLLHRGWQSESQNEANYIATGVNWGYTGAQLSDSIDLGTVLAISALLLLIVFTGYLIIYNVFQISVAGDIRFYGLLKAIGTTGRQLKKVIRLQALILSGAGIPLGLIIGYGVGVKLTPLVLNNLNILVKDIVSINPFVFIGSAVFSLITVLISCRKPERMAARVSPVEAVRHTERIQYKRGRRNGSAGASQLKMAWANLGRNRSKSAVTIVSLALSLVLLNLTFTFTNGFDMDKYLAQVVSDFIVGNAGYFQVSGDWWNKDMAVSEDVIEQITDQGGITAGGRIYGKVSDIQESVTEDYFRTHWGRYNSKEVVDMLVNSTVRLDDGRLADRAQLYGMERYPLDKLSMLEGDISKLYQSGSHYVAAVYIEDDYGNARMDSNWAKLGDIITLRYVEKYEYYDFETGELIDPNALPEDGNYEQRAAEYRDVEYEVAALVTVPSSLSYRYYGTDEFVLNDQTFIQDTGTSYIMQYCFDTEDGSNASMEAFLKDFTNNRQAEYDYESKQTYEKEFESFKSMFLILGSILSFIIGLVGILNFLNVVLTGILSRRHEFAVLQSIGMTGGQLKAILVWEGLYFTLGAVSVALIFSAASGPGMASALEGIFWFFTYGFTLRPVLYAAPVFCLLGIVVPLVVYRVLARQTVVERLREIE